MKPSTTAIVTAAGASSASAMVPFFNTTSTQPFHCPSPFGLFCAGPSMSQNLLMQCTMGNPSPINCIEHTAAQAPIDDYNARCYESAPSAGDAGCAKEGTVYPLSGNPFPLPAGSDDASLPETPTLTASAGAETAFPAPANLTAFPMPTPHFPAPPSPPPAGLASLPKASLPGYVTTVTMGTQTRWHTVFSNCGNGTMLFGTATSSTFASWQTGSIPGELASSEFQSQPQASPSAAAPATIPCDPSTSYAPLPIPTPEPEATTTETSTVSYAIDPTNSTFSPSWIHPTNYATVTVVAAASSFAWSSGEVATPTTSTSTVTASEAVPSMYPSATSSAGFQSGAGDDEESSAAGRGREAPRSWVAVAVVVAVVVWGV
ncbi:hypothetical protein M409DRAFT_50582 [Zasmidium cellare ATCC 36951]|uniref:Uncharacterized protein n=1 Tax=Zasmidium cellare ATCC 36951 TaxID=1080233 RepID=A0A6A6CXM9_ZASCE|nr:uncharacterized protein M409DRAFT_50582 [Zasmidium cellare ATCC 36951]KAF2171977.1 hypothetical protein M409DRAFT_50582 [Zasmidium cellare ATCC 36951]